MTALLCELDSIVNAAKEIQCEDDIDEEDLKFFFVDENIDEFDLSSQ